MALATLTDTGRAVMAESVALRTLHLGWGSGDPAWDASGAELPNLVTATALTNEVGRHSLTHLGFVEPDEAGGIIIPVSIGADNAVEEARYTEVDHPTPYLYCRVDYDYADAATAVIREAGLWIDTELVDGLPEGQRYFTPDQIKSPGKLFAAQIILPPINRSPSVRQSFDFVFPV